MDNITFDRLLLKTAFCCMASDSKIEQRELDLINSMCAKSPYFKDFNFQEEINILLGKLNTQGKSFITYYFELLKKATLTETEELCLIDFAINTIKSDEEIDYAEIKMFKIIRHNLKITDDSILAKFPDIEQFLEEDIITESYLEKITNQYLDSTVLPQFELISGFDVSENKDANKSN
ncbi:MAG: TerB family tellurite resistance protein [Bacteroidetes bacterium]|nr:TerB family tellurite resistance protein [Bacteroidota bacterium]